MAANKSQRSVTLKPSANQSDDVLHPIQETEKNGKINGTGSNRKKSPFNNADLEEHEDRKQQETPKSYDQNANETTKDRKYEIADDKKVNRDEEDTNSKQRNFDKWKIKSIKTLKSKLRENLTKRQGAVEFAVNTAITETSWIIDNPPQFRVSSTIINEALRTMDKIIDSYPGVDIMRCREPPTDFVSYLSLAESWWHKNKSECFGDSFFLPIFDDSLPLFCQKLLIDKDDEVLYRSIYSVFLSELLHLTVTSKTSTKPLVFDSALKQSSNLDQWFVSMGDRYGLKWNLDTKEPEQSNLEYAQNWCESLIRRQKVKCFCCGNDDVLSDRKSMEEFEKCDFWFCKECIISNSDILSVLNMINKCNDFGNYWIVQIYWNNENRWKSAKIISIHFKNIENNDVEYDGDDNKSDHNEITINYLENDMKDVINMDDHDRILRFITNSKGKIPIFPVDLDFSDPMNKSLKIENESLKQEISDLDGMVERLINERNELALNIKQYKQTIEWNEVLLNERNNTIKSLEEQISEYDELYELSLTIKTMNRKNESKGHIYYMYLDRQQIIDGLRFN